MVGKQGSRRRAHVTRSAIASIVLSIGLSVLVCAQSRAATGLAGTWHLEKLSIDRRTNQTVAGPVVQTETPPPESFDESRTIEVAGDVVTVVTTRRFAMPCRATDRFLVDGQPHSFEWGDTLPPETAVWTAAWIQGADGLRLQETYRGTQGQERRWTVSADGQVLTIDTTYDHRARPALQA